MISRKMEHLPVAHKLAMATACIDAVFLYGIEVTSGKISASIIKKADVVRRKALRTILRAPQGTANEIL